MGGGVGDKITVERASQQPIVLKYPLSIPYYDLPWIKRINKMCFGAWDYSFKK